MTARSAVDAPVRSGSSSRVRAGGYDRVAWCYEEIAALYSLGRIQRAKASQLCEFAPGDRVLFAGVGRGEDALLAVRRGVAVTGVDSAARMLRGFRRRLDREGTDARLHCADLLGHGVEGQGYDAVTANFLLNIFSPVEMRRMLAHLVGLVRPGGKLLVADFAAPSGGAAERLLARVYYRPVNVAAWMLRLCALHPLYDYGREMEALGLRVVAREGFRLGVGPVLYESVVAQRD